MFSSMLRVAVEAEALRQVADLRGQRAMLLDRIEADDADRAGVGVQQPAQQPDRRGLAGAVRSDQAEHLAARAPSNDRPSTASVAP